MKTFHILLISILSLAIFALPIPCVADSYKPDDSAVQRMTLNDAISALLILSYGNLKNLYLIGQWQEIKERRFEYDRLIVTTKQGEGVYFTLSKLPEITGSGGLNGHIELAGQPTFESEAFSPSMTINALQFIKQYMIQNVKILDENVSFWGKAYRGEMGVIGIQLKMQDDMPVVDAVLDGMPASGAGIKVGDRITKVDEIFTKGLNLNEVTSLTRGVPDTKLTISIMHSGSDKAEDISLTRVAMKLALSEEARKYKVQAEGAVRDKKFKEAADLYGKVIGVVPWWPDGHFNCALVLSEIGDYEMAMREMKRYLQIVPNASNARAAQDKIYDWERLDSKNKIYEWERRIAKDR